MFIYYIILSTMRIHQLQKSKWLKDKARRKGRGNATGTGNYSGKGLKGQKSRSWFSMKPFFEWGQTSIVQRLPKARGFTRYYKLVKDVAIINLGTLDADDRITDTMEITKELLKELGYIKSVKHLVKLLWQGDYAKHLTFKDIDAFSASAKTKIEKPGTVHSVAKKAPVKIAKDPKSKVWKLKVKSSAEKKVVAKISKPVEKIVEKKVEKKVAPKAAPKVEKVIAEKPVKKAAPKKAPAEKKTAVKKTPSKAK